MSGVLPPGEEFSISMTLTLDFNAMNAKTAVQNQAIAGGYSSDVMTTVTDTSDAGTDPAGTNPGVLGDTGGADDPNLLFICTTNDCYEAINLSLDPNCMRLITPDLLLKENDLALIRPDFYKVQLSFGNGLIISDNTLRIQHVGQNIKALVWYNGPNCPQGMMCVTNITLKSERDVFITSDSARTVYCNDPFLKIDPASDAYPYKPMAMQSCGGQVKGPFFGGDWVTIHDCVLGMQDTAKTIIRQWWAESKDGIRAVAMDTIYVLRLPPLSPASFACVESDTIYCGGPKVQGGPYLLLPNPMNNMDCDTIFFLDKNYQAAVIDSKCGLSVKVDSLIFQNSGCTSLKKYTVTVHQSCYGTDVAGPCTLPMGASSVVIEGGNGQPIYATCEFWLTEIDTLPPMVSCDLSGFGHHVDTINGYPTVTLSAGADCTSMGMVLPDVIASDTCNKVIIVKAMVDTLGPFNYVFNAVSGLWEIDVPQLSLALRPEPYLITLEAFDECLNVGTDTCAIIIADQMAPTAVAHPGLTLELPGKLGYINASQINNNSFDNCGIELILARRSDWQTHWPDFCDSIRFHDVAGPQMDTIWCKFVQPNAAINEFEAYYAEALDNFAMMMGDCGLLLYQSWFYDLCRYATVACKGNLTQENFDVLYGGLYPGTDLEVVSQIGGGWAEKVPFTCEDACQEITVELLVMDYWCNWSTQWSKILVEDKILGSIGATITPEVEMSCTAFQTDSAYTLPGLTGTVPLATVVDQAEVGDSAALALLNSVLGGYEKAWLNAMSQYVDANGEVIDPQIMFTDRGICRCSTTTIQVRYYDVASMSFMTKDSMVTVCYLDQETQPLSKGIIAVNCSENTYCTQTVTTLPGVCNLDTIRRTFKIWKTCGNELPDTVTQQQDIILVNHCELSKSLFNLPPDTIVMACVPEFDPNLSGNVIGPAHPDSIGKPEYIFNDNCRVIGIAHQDKMLTQTNPGTACYIIWRTWYLAEWCDGNTEQPNWWLDENMVADSFTQIIVLTDTTAPTCSIEFVGEVNDTVFMSNCIDNVQARFFTFDTCGTLMYEFSLDTMSDPPTSIWGGFTMLPGNIRDTMELDILNLPQGRYRLQVSLKDHCDNIGMCIDTFVAFCDVNRQAGMVHNQMHSINKMSIKPSTKTGVQLNPDEQPVDLSSRMISSTNFELYQNRPNPFRSNTLIGFDLPETDNVRLSIYDIQGRRLKVIEGKYHSGFHEIELKYSDLNVTGLLYYQLETSKYSATRRMVISP
ncbi:MAG: T9SS type A sorting domain-containing protein, partial [Saprospiraceae bacterium]|nr:T9SS type A sorting domain-containing protein [Saprospiraceae bacterium]